MSAVPERPRLRPRFKAIERFLRRVAFNLGNTPSQTEVKVISCVPIDVTDLQNRIIELENALDQEHEEIVATAVGVPTFQPGAKPVDHNPHPSISSSSPSPDSSIQEVRNSRNENRQRLPKKKPKIPSNRKENVQLMYYAQTSTNFLKEKHSKRKQKERAAESSMSHTYLDDLLQRQYTPLETFSSHFSWPVCRDEPSRNSEICSCYQPRNRYHDFDARRAMDAMSHYPADPKRREYSPYYDSSLYDLIPVRDTTPVSSDQVQRNFYRKSTAKKLHRFPDNPQKPWRTGESQQVNAKHSRARIGHKLRYKITPSNLALKREKVLRAMQRRVADRLSVNEVSQASIECSDKTVQVNPRRKSAPKPTSIPTAPMDRPPVILKNAECLTSTVKDSICQTVTNRSVQFDTPCNDITKTEITLDQIKSILRTVLEEIKSNSQHFADDRLMRDENVQKGSSTLGNIANIPNCERASMANYLYNPYTVPTHSQFVEGCGLSGPYGTRMPQQYPMFIYTPQRCSYCYRSIPQYIPCNSKTQPVYSNTQLNTQKRGTDILIKEIYKSLPRRAFSSENVSQAKIKPVISILTPPNSAESKVHDRNGKKEEQMLQDVNQHSSTTEIRTLRKNPVQDGSHDYRSSTLLRCLLEPQERQPKYDSNFSAREFCLQAQRDGRNRTDEAETKEKQGLYGMIKQLLSSKNRRRRRDTFATLRRNTNFPLSVYTFLCSRS